MFAENKHIMLSIHTEIILVDPKPSFLCHHHNHQFYLGIVRCTEFSYNTVEILKAFFVEVEGHLEQTLFFFAEKWHLKSHHSIRYLVDINLLHFY